MAEAIPAEVAATRVVVEIMAAVSQKAGYRWQENNGTARQPHREAIILKPGKKTISTISTLKSAKSCAASIRHDLSDKPDPDGGYHKIILKTNDDNLKVFTREGYFAPTK